RRLAAALSGRGDVTCAALLQDRLPPLGPGGVLRVDGHEDSTVLHHSLVALRLELGNPHSHEGTGDPTHRATDACASESRHDGASRDERANAWNRQGADADEAAERATDHRPGSCTSSG